LIEMKTLSHEERVTQQDASLQVLARNEAGHHEYEVEGLKLFVHREVFSPHFFNGWSIMTPALREKIKPGARFLEIGCGTGVTSLLLARNGVKVTASDISPLAVENTRINAERNYVELEDILLSDVFEGFKSHRKFDAIYWNSPWMEIIGRNTIDNLLEYGLFDRGFKNHERLLSQAHLYLKPGGKLYLGHASFGDYPRLEAMLDRYGFGFQVVADEPSEEVLDVEFYVYECWLKDRVNQVFLAMPFTGSSFEEIVSKRLEYSAIATSHGLELLEQFIGREKKEEFESALYAPEYIVNKDIDLLNQAQVCLVDLSRASAGASIEIAYARNERNIPVIGFGCPDAKTARHPWVRFYCDEIVSGIHDAMDWAFHYISGQEGIYDKPK